ncbi:hypothetical protein HYN56_11070 [Flavobacterium crocinum]|uniref:Uncharacterized protein n=1 Tax=Flavobacterium crocinum TaxID=2183896 RepID=A0A2S1YKZ5_9FLAO|nr:hypothetical protein [Flavobacterium crocinum]AWK04735.1 hypothetical protein HYN56_11070 [Flavobacterium crocinum]
MKNLIRIATILILFQGCYVQKNIKTGKIKINNSFEKFDGDKIYSEIKRNSSDTIYMYYRPDSFTIIDKDGNRLIEYHKFLGDKFGYFGYDYSKDPLIGIFREFYSNKNIETKGIYCWFGFKMGKWYTFSQEGNLLSVEDFDDGYNFNADKVFLYCKKNNIPLEKGGYFKTFYPYKTKIRKFKSDTKNYWIIDYPDYEKQMDITIQIDALDGNILKRSEKPFYIGE